MVRVIFISLILSLTLLSQDIYEKSCISCHKELPTSLQRIFMKYLKVYGGEENMKAGLKHYLRYPLRDISVMSKLFIDNYPIKIKTTLTDKELETALNIYWERYKIFGRLK